MRASLAVISAGLAVACGLPASSAASAAPRPAARAWIVAWSAEGESGVLVQHAPRAIRPVASLTKLMTAHLVLRYADLDASVVTTPDAVATGESVVPLRVGERQTIGALLGALVVRSANDAAVMLARAVAAEPRARRAIARAVAAQGRTGSGPVARFVALMNAEARALGLGETSYRTPYGLDVPGAHSSARDVLVLSRLVMRDARFRNLARRSVVVLPGGHRLPTRNTLLGRYRSLDGVKTGHTDEAGWNLSAHAVRHRVQVSVVDLGAPTPGRRDSDVAALLDWAFAELPAVTLVRTGQAYGQVDGVQAIAARPLSAVLGPGRRIRLRIVVPDHLDRPVTRGAQIGELRVVRLSDGRELGSVALVADRTGGGGRGVLQRLRAGIASLF